MTVEGWITLGSAAATLLVGGIGIPAAAWLAREVLALRNDLVALRGKIALLEERNETRDRDCQRHQKWLGDIQEGVTDLRTGQAAQGATLDAIAANLGVKHR